MDIAIKQRKCKALQKERIGKDFSIACDEQKRLLVICSSAKVCKFASLKSPIWLISTVPAPRVQYRQAFLCSATTWKPCRTWTMVWSGDDHPPCFVYLWIWRASPCWLEQQGKNLLLYHSNDQVSIISSTQTSTAYPSIKAIYFATTTVTIRSVFVSRWILFHHFDGECSTCVPLGHVWRKWRRPSPAPDDPVQPRLTTDIPREQKQCSPANPGSG